MAVRTVETEDQEAAGYIGFALDVMFQQKEWEKHFKIDVIRHGFAREYKITFRGNKNEKHSVGFYISSSDPLTIPLDVLATITLLLG